MEFKKNQLVEVKLMIWAMKERASAMQTAMSSF